MAVFAKFFLVGILNTGIDLLVLNSLIFIFGVGTSGFLYPLFKSVSFIAAVTNSYLFNKFWVFKHRTSVDAFETLRFFAISGMGLLFNIGVSFLVFSLLRSVGGIPLHLSTNIGAIVGSAAVLLWNFTGYKFLVFRNKKETI